MSDYDLGKLKRSLILRVHERLSEMLPEADVQIHEQQIAIRYDTLEGSIDITEMVKMCHQQERSHWGAIAGDFCNVVCSRVMAHFSDPIQAPDMANIFPVVVGADDEYDAMISGATPNEGLQCVSSDWLSGFRVEFEYRGQELGRRIFNKDLDGMGIDAESLETLAMDNLNKSVINVDMKAIGGGDVTSKILAVRGDLLGPSLLLSEPGRALMLGYMSEAQADTVTRMMVVMPKTDLILFCDVRNRNAASLMVSSAWSSIESGAGDSVPLSPKILSVDSGDGVALFDVGLSADKVPDWEPHTLGPVAFLMPPDWRVTSDSDTHWTVTTAEDCPAISITTMLEGNNSPMVARGLAEQTIKSAAPTSVIGHGFFNGLGWARADLGIQDDAITGVVFVACGYAIVKMVTKVPKAIAPQLMLSVQKVLSSIRPV